MHGGGRFEFREKKKKEEEEKEKGLGGEEREKGEKGEKGEEILKEGKEGERREKGGWRDWKRMKKRLAGASIHTIQSHHQQRREFIRAVIQSMISSFRRGHMKQCFKNKLLHTKTGAHVNTYKSVTVR